MILFSGVWGMLWMEKWVKGKEKIPIFGKSIQFLNKNFGWGK